MKEAMQGINPVIDAVNGSQRTSVFYAEIKSVDPHNQTMVVSSPIEGKPITVPINNAVSYTGEGIRYMPSPNSMLALILRDGASPQHYHIGYFFKDAKSLTDNRSYTNNSDRVAHRFLEKGEVQLVGRKLNEVYLSNDGSILIKSGNGQFINLNDEDMFCDSYFGTMHTELENVRVRAGNVRRATDLTDGTSAAVKDLSTHEDDYILDNDDEYIPEFSVSVGVTTDEDGRDLDTIDSYTGVDNYPYVAALTISSKVFDNQGNEEKVLDKNLKLLAKFPVGVSLAIDDEGSFVILDQTNNNYIRFKTGIDANDPNIPLTEYEIKVNNASVKINNDTITVLDNKENSITLDENGIVVNSKTLLTLLSNGGGGEELSILGETLKAWLESHTHTTGVGPSGIAIQAAQLSNILSAKTKNN